MLIRFIDKNAKKRDAIIKRILPKETIVGTILEPAVEKRLFDIIAKCIRQEVDIYRKYPKSSESTGKKEGRKKTLKTFDPRNNSTCFMGKAFRGNNNVTDSELHNYRKAIGTVIHPVWGDCTLMEIWGGDHFEEYNKMVTDTFKYGMGLRKTCPVIKVYVNPLFQNSKSKEFKLSEAQQEYKKDMEELLARAMIFGVRTREEAKKANRRGF